MQVQRHAQSWTRERRVIYRDRDIYIMRQWKAKSVAASNDDELADFINNIESEPDRKVKEVIFIGNDSTNAKLYQILYVEG